MKLSKQYILEQLKTKTPREIAEQIVKAQMSAIPVGYELQFDATIAKYTKLIEGVKKKS